MGLVRATILPDSSEEELAAEPATFFIEPEKQPIKIGVISDTHGFFDPALREYLVGVGAILHAGDVDSQSVLDDLAEIAPVQAVRGNVDSVELNLPLSRTLRFEKVQIQLQHILPVSQSELGAWSDGALPGNIESKRRTAFLKTFAKETQVVIFGHSHQPCFLTLGHTLYLNPGSAGKKRFSLPRCYGVLEIFPRAIQGIIRSLEGEEGNLPGKIWLPFSE